MMKQAKYLAGLALGLMLAGGTAAYPAPPAAVTRYDIALIGDLPYSDAEEKAFVAMMGRIDQANVAFVIHDGDFKSGSSPCTDEGFQHALGLFRHSRHPFIFIPGDNDWTDCHRKGGDPLERLQKLRQMFWQGDRSLGQEQIKLQRQPDYPENVIWSHGAVLYVGLNIPGSNNNLGRTPAMDEEYRQRNAANLAWLHDAFAQAKQQGALGVMPIIQANPGFELKPEERTGYNDFLMALQTETVAFPGRVVLVHGDSHYFRLDMPMRSKSTLDMVNNFTRLETFGSPFSYWVSVTIDPADPALFQFHPHVELHRPSPSPVSSH